MYYIHFSTFIRACLYFICLIHFDFALSSSNLSRFFKDLCDFSKDDSKRPFFKKKNNNNNNNSHPVFNGMAKLFHLHFLRCANAN